jgi:hypothetical protein
MVITTVVLGAIGIVVYLSVRGRIEAPIGDRLRSASAQVLSAAGLATPDEGTSSVDRDPNKGGREDQIPPAKPQDSA